MNLHIRVEGTTAEISDVLRALPGAATVHTTAVELTNAGAQATPGPETLKPESGFVTTRFARRVLKRLPLSTPMKNVLRALYKAHPKRLSQATLQDVAGYQPSQYAGMMGAFGRRIANTEGYDSETQFFDWRQGDEEETWYYRLPDTVREALTLEELV